MSGPGITAIRIRRGEHVFHVHGDKAGQEGVWLAKGQVQGLYEVPVKTTYKTGAFQVGSTQKAVKWKHRDMQLGFHLTETVANTYEWNESAFRQIFGYEDDPYATTVTPTTIEVVTDLSGLRKLDVLMYEEPEFAPAVDPIKQQHGQLILKLRAAQPMWYEDDLTSTFDGGTATSAVGTVLLENPTDQVMYHKWVLTSAKTSGDIYWKLPDFSWTGDPGEREPGGDDEERYIQHIEVTAANDGCTIDLDRSQLMYRDAADTNMLGQQGAQKIFTHPIPPWTPSTYLPVSYHSGTGGGTAQLIMPRRWSKPWGLEPVTVIDTSSPKDLTWRIHTVGTFQYQIPHWCERLDIVCVGGGGGGEGGALLLNGSGGDAAGWGYATVIRGVDIPWDTYIIAGTVGRGGYGGHGVDWTPTLGDLVGVDGGAGQSSWAEASGMATVSSAGGAGGKLQPNTWGLGLDDLELNGKTYPGCGTELIAGNVGNHPGGGGAGGWVLIGAGGDGGNGQIWIRAYGWSGS